MQHDKYAALSAAWFALSQERGKLNMSKHTFSINNPNECTGFAVGSFNLLPNTLNIAGYKHILNRGTYPGSFLYIDKQYNVKSVYIKNIIYNNPAVIVFWSDNTKTVSKCLPNDTWSPEFALLDCIVKKTNPEMKLDELFETWVPKSAWVKNGKVVHTLADVRKNKRKK